MMEIDLPRALREELAKVCTEAEIAWMRERLGRMSRAQLEALHAERRREIEEELRAGAWGHALRAAAKGDGSRLAMLLIHGGVPPELAGVVYRFIVAAPWRDRRRGGQRRLNAEAEAGVRNMYVFEHVFNRRPRNVVLDELVHRYGVSRSTIERAVARWGAHRPRAASRTPDL
jgi:hypothetical protein